MLRFEWDEAKNRRNRRKHGIWFEEATSVFDDHRGRVFVDETTPAAEDRFLIVGMNTQARLLVVVHCYRTADAVIRLISARKATRKETRYYEEGI